MRTFCIALTALCLVLTGCEKKPTEPTKPPKPTTGTVVIFKTPTYAQVVMNNTTYNANRSPVEITLPAGNYGYFVAAYGYYPFRDSLTITAGKVDSVYVTLSPQLLFPLKITSDPMGSIVAIPGWGSRPTPFLQQLDTGTYAIRLTYPDYADWDTTFHHTTKDSVNLHVDMKRLMGSISITSEPTAHVYLDDQDTYLETPVIISDVLATTHHIRLTRVDYDDWSGDVTVIANDTVSVTAQLNHQTGTINLNSDPQNAPIFLDGSPTGFSTPASIQNVVSGNHAIRITLGRYYDWDTTLSVPSNGTASAFVQLRQIPAKLSVFSQSGTGTVYINDSLVGSLPFHLDSIPDGYYRLMVQQTGKFPYFQSFTAEFGSQYSFTATSELCPATQLMYTVADTIFRVGLDGISPQVVATDYAGDGPGLSWSPDGSSLVYAGENGIVVLDASGNVRYTFSDYAGYRSNDFNWSPDSKHLVFGRYWAGIYRLDIETGEIVHILQSKSATYDANPVYDPTGQYIIFAHHEWGYSVWLFIMKTDGSEVRQLTDRFPTEYDEYLSMTWIDNHTVVFKKSYNPPGLFEVDVSQLTDSTLAPVTQLSSNLFPPLFFTSDRASYLTWLNGNQVMLGSTGNWNEFTKLMEGTGVYWLDWSNDENALGVRSEFGLYWVTRSGTSRRIGLLPTGSGSVQVKP